MPVKAPIRAGTDDFRGFGPVFCVGQDSLCPFFGAGGGGEIWFFGDNDTGNITQCFQSFHKQASPSSSEAGGDRFTWFSLVAYGEWK